MVERRVANPASVHSERAPERNLEREKHREAAHDSREIRATLGEPGPDLRRHTPDHRHPQAPKPSRHPGVEGGRIHQEGRTRRVTYRAQTKAGSRPERLRNHTKSVPKAVGVDHLKIKERGDPGLFQRRSAKPPHLPQTPPQRTHSGCPQRVSRGLCGHDQETVSRGATCGQRPAVKALFMAISLQERTCGLLLHPTSLPGPHGCGDLGPAAFAFANWAASAGQRIWQMLPVVPPAGGSSPYQSNSAFAGSPWLVSLEQLHQDGLLTEADLVAEGLPADRVDFGATERFREERLRRAFEAFRNQPGDAFFAFCQREKAWLDDFALYCALKKAHDDKVWSKWPQPLRTRAPEALRQAAEEHKAEVRFHQFVQYQFHKQWTALRAHCASLGLALVGDIPIFVAHDSADVWQNPKLFFLDSDGEPTVVAGVPPDYFSATGQRWGNVLYRWDAHRAQGYTWWVARFRSMFEKFDAVRVDHFIGFHRYWEIDASCPTAIDGRYRPGPGIPFFQALEKELGRMPIIAEDLGVVTPEVDALRKHFGFPGMKVLHFSFSSDPTARHILPFTFEKDIVVYTGTHDNNTSQGWFAELDATPIERAFVLDYLGTDGHEIHWDLLRLAYQSQATLAIVPVQDLLGLGATSRMNTPGVAEGNWSYRLRDGALEDTLRRRLKRLGEVCGRTRP